MNNKHDKVMGKTIWIFVFFICFIHLGAQSVQIVEEEPIKAMMTRYIENNKSNELIRGWRIQIITTNDRRNMESARAKFQGLYPGIPISWEHETPYYKVKIGAYKDKINLQPYLQMFKKDFPTAIPILENMKKSELIY